MWKQSPLATRSQRIKDCVHDSTHVGRERPSTIASRRQQWFDQFPRRIRQVRLVASVQHQQVPPAESLMPHASEGMRTFQTSSQKEAYGQRVDMDPPRRVEERGWPGLQRGILAGAAVKGVSDGAHTSALTVRMQPLVAQLRLRSAGHRVGHEAPGEPAEVGRSS